MAKAKINLAEELKRLQKQLEKAYNSDNLVAVIHTEAKIETVKKAMALCHSF